MATVYINSSTGNDSNTYVQAQSSATPWLTFGKANSAATTGDTVVLDGTFTLTASVAHSTKQLNYQVGSSGVATVSGANLYLISGAAAAGYTFTGIKFTTFKQSVYCLAFDGATFTNCQFVDFNCAAADVTSYHGAFGNTVSGTYTFTFTNCKFRNFFSASNGVGIAYIFGYRSFGGGGSPSLIVTNCTFDFNTNWSTAAGFTIYGNFYAISGGSDTLKNNIYINNTGQVITFNQTRTASTVRTSTYSCAYNITSPLAGTGNITSDPLCVDSVNDNYNLRPSSPCIDTATNS